MPPMRILALTLTVAAAALWLWGCGRPPHAPPPPPGVVVGTAVQRDVVSYYHYTGNTAAVDQVDIRARVPGYLRAKHYETSTDIAAGTLLFTIEPEPYEAAVAAAQAQVRRARASLDLAKLRQQKVEEAFRKSAATEFERLEVEAQRRESEADLEAAQASLDDANIQLGYTRVVTPIAGRVNRELVDVGNLVGQGEPTLLTTVVTMDPIYAYFDVSERIVLEYLGRGRSGNMDEGPKPPTLELARANDPEDAYPFVGVVDFVDNIVDAETGTIRVRGVFANPDGKLFPGLFVRIRAPDETLPDALLVQQDAVLTGLNGKYLLTVGDDDVVHRRPVTLGPRDGGQVVVVQGLAAGERYITRGVQKARPGQKVMILPDHATPSAAPGGGG